ncbi:MAG: hypothetical protein J6K77_00085 [Ruminococcus sp.]|nr:hypothetical protein [Ruminococcus sp.]
MNIEKIKKLFTLFSGEEYEEKHQTILELGIAEVTKMLREDADEEDSRLDFLAAADANYRYCQAMLSADGKLYTYGGSLPDSSAAGKWSILDFAGNLLKDYCQMCRDLITTDTFVFFGFSEGGEAQWTAS